MTSKFKMYICLILLTALAGFGIVYIDRCGGCMMAEKVETKLPEGLLQPFEEKLIYDNGNGEEYYCVHGKTVFVKHKGTPVQLVLMLPTSCIAFKRSTLGPKLRERL